MISRYSSKLQSLARHHPIDVPATPTLPDLDAHRRYPRAQIIHRRRMQPPLFCVFKLIELSWWLIASRSGTTVGSPRETRARNGPPPKLGRPKL